MHHLATVLLLLAFGCTWDTDTLRDEANVRPDVWEVISDQFPRHGEAYYHQRIRLITAQAKPDRTSRNDLAVAHLRLRQYEPAEKLLQELRSENPGEYEAMSNQAVLWRNQGRFADAVSLFEQTLKVRPEGHLGLGDWTLRAVRWQARVQADPSLAQREDFLGRGRVDVGEFLPQHNATSIAWDLLPKEQQDRLRLLNLLLRNYVIFAEGFLVLGDELAEIGDSNLALHAYARALDLGHPAPDLVRAHILAVATRISRWTPLLKDAGLAKDRALAQVMDEVRGNLSKSQVWSKAFILAEGEAVAQGTLPSFEDTLARLTTKGVTIHLPITAQDRRAQIYSAWIEGIDLVKKKKWAEAEPVLAKACAQAKQIMPEDGDRARLMMVYAASLSPQGGEKRLCAAAKVLDEAEVILRAEKDVDQESLLMVLGNLEKVHDALGDAANAAKASERRRQLQPVNP